MRVSGRIFDGVLAALLFTALSAPAFAQQSDLDTLAADLAKVIERPLVARTLKPKVAVVVFSRSDRTVTQLGFVLAGQFGIALAREAKGFEILDPEKLESARKQERWSEREMQEEGIACAVAQLAGAGIVVFGRHEKVKDWANGVQVELRAVLASAEGRKKIGEVRGRISLPSEWRLLDSQSRPSAPDMAQFSGIPTAPLPDGVFKPGRDGVSFPECEYCPDPRYTDEARAAKTFSAQVLLRVIVSADGRPREIAVIQAARFKLTEAAIETVRTWRFKPAQNRDGKPVSVQVVIEVTFHSLK